MTAGLILRPRACGARGPAPLPGCTHEARPDCQAQWQTSSHPVQDCTHPCTHMLGCTHTTCTHSDTHLCVPAGSSGRHSGPTDGCSQLSQEERSSEILANSPGYMRVASKANPWTLPAALGCLSGDNPFLAVCLSQLGPMKVAGGHSPSGCGSLRCWGGEGEVRGRGSHKGQETTRSPSLRQRGRAGVCVRV